MAHIGVVIGQLVRLFGDGVGYFGPAIACVHAIKPGKGVQHPVAIAVLDMDARRPCDHPRRGFTPRMLC